MGPPPSPPLPSLWRVVLLLLLCGVPHLHATARVLFKVALEDPTLLPAVQARPDFDLWQARRVGGSVVATVAAPDASMQRFLTLHPRVRVVHREALGPVPNPASRRTGDTYRTADEMEAAMRALETAYPALAKVYNIGTSVQNRTILAVKLSRSPLTDDPTKPEVVFVAGHHAREWISMEVGLRLAEYVACVQAVVPRITALLNTVELWFIPLLNPDGYVYTYQAGGDRYWRKNREKNIGGSYGVDLNRNYDYLWSLLGASNDPDSETYLGPAPLSEPEVQALRNLLGYRNASQTITLAVSADALQDTNGSTAASITSMYSHPAVTGWRRNTTYLAWTTPVSPGVRYAVEVLQSAAQASQATFNVTLNCTNGSTVFPAAIVGTYKSYMQYVLLGYVTPVVPWCRIEMWATGFSGFGSLATIYGLRLANRDAPLVRPSALLSRPIGMLSYHSYGQSIAWPVSGEYQAPANNALLSGVATKMAGLIQQTTQATYSPIIASDTYLASGDAVDWFWYNHDGAPGYTIELPPADAFGTTGFVLGTDQIEPTTRGNVPAALYFAEYVGKHQNATWYQQPFVDDVDSTASGWFPACGAPPACLALALCSAANPAAGPSALAIVAIALLAVLLLAGVVVAVKVFVVPRWCARRSGPGEAFQPFPT